MPQSVPETTRWHCQITRTLSVWSELLLHLQFLFLSHSLCGLFITLGIGCGVCVCGYAGGLYSHSQLGEPRGAPVDRGPQSGCHQSPQGLSRTRVRRCWGRPSLSLSGELPGLVGGGHWTLLLDCHGLRMLSARPGGCLEGSCLWDGIPKQGGAL